MQPKICAFAIQNRKKNWIGAYLAYRTLYNLIFFLIDESRFTILTSSTHCRLISVIHEGDSNLVKSVAIVIMQCDHSFDVNTF